MQHNPDMGTESEWGPKLFGDLDGDRNLVGTELGTEMGGQAGGRNGGPKWGPKLWPT